MKHLYRIVATFSVKDFFGVGFDGKSNQELIEHGLRVTLEIVIRFGWIGFNVVLAQEFHLGMSF